MKQSLYLFSNCTIKRKDNTLMFDIDGTKKFRPVEAVADIFLFGEHTLNTKFLFTYLIITDFIPVPFSQESSIFQDMLQSARQSIILIRGKECF